MTLLFMSGVAPIEDVPPCKIPLRDGMPPSEAEWIAEAALIAPPAGALIGGAIGAQKTGWKPIFCLER